jgi:hypothetical protein
MTQQTYKHGDKVKLFPFEDEPEQKAVVLGGPENEMYVVALLPEYLTDPYDDGLRECSADQMELLP